MQRYSALSLAWHALRGNKHWQPAWCDATPKRTYEVIVIGGGGHGLATRITWHANTVPVS
jgi:sarcosine oxidase subunit beta